MLNDFLSKQDDKSIREFLKEIRNDHFILLLMILNYEAKKRIYDNLSDEAVTKVEQDLVKFKAHIRKISPEI